MLKFLLSAVMWFASPPDQKPNAHLGCQFLLTTVKTVGREAQIVLRGGLSVSSKLLKLLRQNRRAEYLSELARSKDFEFQFEPLVKFRDAFEGSLSAQREINHAEIQRLYETGVAPFPLVGTILSPDREEEVGRWLAAHRPGWRRMGVYVLDARRTVRLFAEGSNERRDFLPGTLILLSDRIVVDAFEGPPLPTFGVGDGARSGATGTARGEAPLEFHFSRARWLWSRFRGSF